MPKSQFAQEIFKPPGMELSHETTIVEILSSSTTKLLSQKYQVFHPVVFNPTLEGTTTLPTHRRHPQDLDHEDRSRRTATNPGNNAHTSFNFFLKTPHAHVASGYNSQSRKSFLFNQPTAEAGAKSSSPVPEFQKNFSSNSSTDVRESTSPGQNTVLYRLNSSFPTPTINPVGRTTAAMPTSKAILEPTLMATTKPVQTLRTPVPRFSKYEFEDLYDAFPDKEDYLLEQKNSPKVPNLTMTIPKQRNTGRNLTVTIVEDSLSEDISDFKKGRSTKQRPTLGFSDVDTKERTLDIPPGDDTLIQNRKKPSPELHSNPPDSIKILSSSVVLGNSTDEQYYYEDDYMENDTPQQNRQSDLDRSRPSTALLGRTTIVQSSDSSALSPKDFSIDISNSKSTYNFTTLPSNGVKNSEPNMLKIGNSSKDKVFLSDYYDDDDSTNLNAHNHHFVHVDVPRIPFAKPNVPRVLVTNGKPFLPRLRRQSHLGIPTNKR